MKARAFLARQSAGGPLAALCEGMHAIDLCRLVRPGDRVFLKPNLTFPTYRPGVMTSLPVIEAALQTLRDYTPHVYVGDADGGGYNRFSMEQVYREIGLWATADRHGARVVNLSAGERRTISIRRGRRELAVALPRLLLEEIDLLVSLPVPKVHASAGVSLSWKNQWGCIPDPADRLRLHPYLPEVLVALNQAVKAGVAIVDGRYGLNANGPMRGQPVELDWLMVADSLGAADRLACALMQVRLESIPHLRHAACAGLVPELSEIALEQDLGAFLGPKFVLKRQWTDYPGLLAFRSPLLAYLAYFSPLADLLHRLLYLVREPFYEYR